MTTVEDTLSKMEETSEDNSKKLDSILALLANKSGVHLSSIYSSKVGGIYSPKVLLTCSTQLEEKILSDRRAERQDLHIRKAFGPGLPVHPSRLPQSQPQTHCL
jgi:hypothetical protein